MKSIAISQKQKSDSLLTRKYTKSSKTFNMLYKKEWVDKYSWHIHRPFLNGGLYKTCVLFDTPDVRNRGIFVKKKLFRTSLNQKNSRAQLLPVSQ